MGNLAHEPLFPTSLMMRVGAETRQRGVVLWVKMSSAELGGVAKPPSLDHFISRCSVGAQSQRDSLDSA